MSRRKIVTGAVVAVLACAVSAAAQPVAVARLRCEWAVNPLGIDGRQPRLSWVLNRPAAGPAERVPGPVLRTRPR
jgi:hypothetical protein